MPMPTGPFVVGVIFATASTVYGLRQLKYRSELFRYGFNEEYQPFGSKTPIADSKDYKMELRRRIREGKSKQNPEFASKTNELAHFLCESADSLFAKLYETADTLEKTIVGK